MEKPTHIIVSYPSQNSLALFRASDGMAIGHAQNFTVIFGDDPAKREGRNFIDHDHAVRFLRNEVTREDLGVNGGLVIIEDRDGEGLVVPVGKVDMAQINSRPQPFAGLPLKKNTN